MGSLASEAPADEWSADQENIGNAESYNHHSQRLQNQLGRALGGGEVELFCDYNISMKAYSRWKLYLLWWFRQIVMFAVPKSRVVVKEKEAARSKIE